MAKRRAPTCPTCGQVATKSTTKFGVRYDHCGLWAWGRHPLADARTHYMRQRAHKAFDRLWTSRRMSRSQAYTALASELGIQKHECHMKLMPADVAERVPLAAVAISLRLKAAYAASATAPPAR